MKKPPCRETSDGGFKGFTWLGDNQGSEAVRIKRTRSPLKHRQMPVEGGIQDFARKISTELGKSVRKAPTRMSRGLGAPSNALLDCAKQAKARDFVIRKRT